MRTSSRQLSSLSHKIAEFFNEDELRFLCAELDIKHGDLSGETHSARALSLVEYCDRHNRLLDLLSYLQDERPHVQWTHPELVTPAVSPLTPRSRDNLLNNIQHNWIDGFLKQSLYSEIELIVGYRPDAVGHIVLKQAGRPDQTVTRERLPEIFTASGRNLLILGEPGSGKTITLLQLAESLLDEARQDANAPVPLVLNLSSWAREQRPLVEWLVEEAFLQYGVPRDFTRAGITGNNFYYLLDGLDEVAAEARDACAAAINEFKAIHPAEMVVCCRVSEYEALQQPLHLGSAIQIRPLNEAQINDYLSKPELELQAVQTTLAHDPDLRELAQLPLHLSMITLAYKGLSREQLRPLRSTTTRHRHLFDSYVVKMFERRPLPQESSYTKPQALHWLANLARGMEQHEQTNFYIEHLQPTWLSDARLLPYRMIEGLLIAVFAGPLVGMTIGMIFWLAEGPRAGLLWGLLGALFGGPGGMLAFWLSVRQSNKPFSRKLSKFFEIRPYAAPIELVEDLAWQIPSRRKAWSIIWPLIKTSPFPMVLLVVFTGLAMILFSRLLGELNAILSGLLKITAWIVGMLVIGIFGILLNIIPELMSLQTVHKRLEPNQGILYSRRNTIRMAPKLGIICALFIGFIFAMIYALLDMLFFGLLLGMGAGLVAGLVIGVIEFGGVTWLQHYALRWLLARAGVLPPFSWRDRPFIEFLDAMHDRILLRRVGGGWVFIHRTLQEYFAEQAGDEGVRG